MPNKPSHFIWYELMTTAPDLAAKFYGAVVGWSVGDSGQTDKTYQQWSIGGQTVGGLMAIPQDASEHGMRPMWAGYLNVDNVDASIAAIKAAGGAVHMPGTDIPGIGRFAMVSDPQGAIFYVMTPISAQPSPSFSPGAAGHGGWNELHTSDWPAALKFYGEQFGFGKTDAMDMGPGGTYLLFNTGEGPVGGMFNNSDFPRPMWLYYFNVDDIEAAKTRVEGAGGAVLNGPHQVPTGDWILQARDPQGAMFALVGPHAG
jgi:predicted enzyme related to lactoylglutathione lyase